MVLYSNREYEYRITPDNIPNDGILFADHSPEHRSGHLGHAMVEYAPGCILAFYSDSDGEKYSGHNGNGWTWFRRSTDYGQTWEAPEYYPYSKTLYDLKLGIYASTEKAVCAPNGDIVVFNCISDLIDSKGRAWEPFGIPTYTRSSDGGHTWFGTGALCEERGRIYDAHVHDGKIYVLVEFGGNPYVGKLTEYHMYVSEDNGETFTDYSRLPFRPTMTVCRFYGTFEWLDNGDIIAYSYQDREDEMHIDYCLSHDNGKTWDDVKDTYFAKRIRNPQLVHFGNSFFMLGRSGSYGPDEQMGHNIVYCSPDGINWDEGQYLRIRKNGCGGYSNTLVVHTPEGQPDRLLYQASYAYERNRTNALHWWIDYTVK